MDIDLEKAMQLPMTKRKRPMTTQNKAQRTGQYSNVARTRPESSHFSMNAGAKQHFLAASTANMNSDYQENEGVASPKVKFQSYADGGKMFHDDVSSV